MSSATYSLKSTEKNNTERDVYYCIDIKCQPYQINFNASHCEWCGKWIFFVYASKSAMTWAINVKETSAVDLKSKNLHMTLLQAVDLFYLTSKCHRNQRNEKQKTSKLLRFRSIESFLIRNSFGMGGLFYFCLLSLLFVHARHFTFVHWFFSILM